MRNIKYPHSMALLQSGVIALWLGHESIETTNAYLHANLAMKENALAKVLPVGTPFCRFQRRRGPRLFLSCNFAAQSEIHMHKGLHVAIIMDGNGRWATQSGLPRVAGHRAGVAAVRRVVEHAPALGIRWLTLCAFSSDNWRRPVDEVESIFWLMRAYLRLETDRLRQHGARLEIIGRRDRLPNLLLREIGVLAS
jgi:hypothetical protein